MKKRINLVQKGNKKLLCYTALVVLTKSQAEKLADESLIKQIDALSNDLNVYWAVEISGDYEIAAISRTTLTGVIGEEMLSSLEKVAHEFIQAIDKMEIPAPEPECPSHEERTEEEHQLEFVKELLHDVSLPDEDEERVIGGEILAYGPKSCPFPLAWGKISSDLLKEMCELYIKAHEND